MCLKTPNRKGAPRKLGLSLEDISGACLDAIGPGTGRIGTSSELWMWCLVGLLAQSLQALEGWYFLADSVDIIYIYIKYDKIW